MALRDVLGVVTRLPLVARALPPRGDASVGRQNRRFAGAAALRWRGDAHGACWRGGVAIARRGRACLCL